MTTFPARVGAGRREAMAEPRNLVSGLDKLQRSWFSDPAYGGDKEHGWLWRMAARELGNMLDNVGTECDKVMALLERCEWSSSDGYLGDRPAFCPECGGHAPVSDGPADWLGHRPDCEVAAALRGE